MDVLCHCEVTSSTQLPLSLIALIGQEAHKIQKVAGGPEIQLATVLIVVLVAGEPSLSEPSPQSRHSTACQSCQICDPRWDSRIPRLRAARRRFTTPKKGSPSTHYGQ